MLADFNVAWKKIVEHEGEVFLTKMGLEFVYRINGNILRTNRTDYGIHKSNFSSAWRSLPTEGPGALSRTIRGSSYVWAILNDIRIKD